MGDAKPMTREALVGALIAKRALNTGSFPSEISIAQEIADCIRRHGLESVLTGARHDGKPVTFARGFELCFGERLSLKRSA